jgi:coenzyme F420 hydrogenase subunit beta
MNAKVSPPEKYGTVTGVVEDNLCHSCGVCGGICPSAAISFDDRALPLVYPDLCTLCGLCVQVCSGWQGTAVAEHPDGCQRTVLAASTDSRLREKSSSGGLVTELLRFLLNSGQIKQVLVTIADPANPARAISILARTEDELLQSCQSRYSLFPWGQTLRELLRTTEPYAVVGTSCQLSSFKNALRIFPKLRNNLLLMIGICCESNIEPVATDHLLRIRGIKKENLQRIEFRSGKWPGVMAAFLHDGSEVVLSNRNRLEGAINYLKLAYGRDRCNYCSDVLCEVADITVGDPWGRDEEGFLKYRGSAGYSAAIARSETVLQMLSEMVQDKRIELHEETEPNTFLGVQERQVRAAQLKVAKQAITGRRKGRPIIATAAKDLAVGPGLSLAEKCARLVGRIAHYEPFRSIILRVMLSTLGDTLTAINSRRKQRSARVRRT